MVGVEFGASAIEAIENLKKAFWVRSNADVIRRALALAQIVAGEADEQHNVLVLGKNKPIKVSLSG